MFILGMPVMTLSPMTLVHHSLFSIVRTCAGTMHKRLITLNKRVQFQLPMSGLYTCLMMVSYFFFIVYTVLFLIKKCHHVLHIPVEE